MKERVKPITLAKETGQAVVEKKSQRLADLPNIGPVLEKALQAVEIETPEELIQMGSKGAFLHLQVLDSGACLHSLYALEGAIQNIPYPMLTKEKKEELKKFFRENNKKG